MTQAATLLSSPCRHVPQLAVPQLAVTKHTRRSFVRRAETFLTERKAAADRPKKPHGGASEPAAITANASPQPAANAADASQLGALPTVRLKLRRHYSVRVTRFAEQTAASRPVNVELLRA